MSKAVLMSIQPYWVFLIIAKAMGWNIDKEKTVEVRKSYPKSENWNKVVKIYCSKDKKSFNKIPKEYQPFMKQLLGKVPGEFVCDEIYSDALFNVKTCMLSDKACITPMEIGRYLKPKQLAHFLNISNLKIYDESKELWHFFKPCGDCDKKGTRRCTEEISDCRAKTITRPPQSWCYVEEKE